MSGPKCPVCSREMARAVLTKEHWWCEVCAQEYLPDLTPLNPKPKATVRMVKTENALVDDESGPIAEIGLPAPAQSAESPGDQTRRFEVTVDQTRFVAYGKVELYIAGTKVIVQ